MSEEKRLQFSSQLAFEEQEEIAVVLSEKETLALYKKSQNSEHSFDTLNEVYRRGYLSWDLHLNESPEQTAFNRVNSFIAGGFAAELDHDLVEGVINEKTNIPQKYRSGLSDKTAAARKAHWDKMSKYSDRDPRAYEPAPGDATAKTKPSKHTEKFKKMYGEEMNIDEAAESGLAAKAKKSGISIGTLRKVYNRGMAAWNSGHRPGTTPQQWAMARVNSYITKGKGTYHGADKDLRSEEVEVDEACWASHRQAGMKKKGNRMVPNCVPKEEYTGAEKVSKNMNDPASRFVGTDELTNTYKNATPGQKVKKIVKENSRTADIYFAKGRQMLKLKRLKAAAAKQPQMTKDQMRKEFEDAMKNTAKKVVKEVVEEKLYEMYNCGCNKCGEIEESGLRAKHKSPSGGLTQAGRDYYNRTAGANLKAPVTTKPSKLKKGSKSANRRKSFCARMGGMKKRLTSAKTARDPDSRINKALRKWNC